MKNPKSTHTTWHAEKNLLVTVIQGDLDKEDIERWEASLDAAMEQIESGSLFKFMVNMHGFKAVDIDAHKRFRAIIPLTLAQYNWKVGYVDLFEKEASEMVFTATRNICCAGAAHAHHDATKMELYQARFSRPNEQFFTDPDAALQWIEHLALPSVS
jgi:hypothetical protein